MGRENCPSIKFGLWTPVLSISEHPVKFHQVVAISSILVEINKKKKLTHFFLEGVREKKIKKNEGRFSSSSIQKHILTLIRHWCNNLVGQMPCLFYQINWNGVETEGMIQHAKALQWTRSLERELEELKAKGT